MLNINYVEFNHVFINDVKRLLSEGYVDLPKNYEKHPLKDQKNETIYDVLCREYAEKYLLDPTNTKNRQVLANTIKAGLSDRARLQWLNSDGTPSGETPLNKLKTKNLEAGTKRNVDPNQIFMTSLFSNNLPLIVEKEDIAAENEIVEETEETIID